LTYEGIFNEYYFETGHEEEKLFGNTYFAASSKDPISGKLEEYLVVGMNSKTDGEGFYKHGGRPNMNFIIILDKSGSMSDIFPGANKSKLEVAKDVIIAALLNKMKPDDNICLITFDSEAKVLQPLQTIKNVDTSNLKNIVMSIKIGGSTVMTPPLIESKTQVLSFNKSHESSIETRIFYVTDGLPTDSENDTIHLTAKDLADNKIYTTWLGVGIDFNQTLIDKLTKVKANNYYSVKSAHNFTKLFNEEFDYVASADIFDAVVKYSGGGFEVERVYGSNGFEIPVNSVLFEMSSGFPSPKESENLTKGGIMVIKLKRIEGGSPTINFTITYTDRHGAKYEHKELYEFPKHDSETEDFYQGSAARKGVLLVRYVNFMKNYLMDEIDGRKPETRINSRDGIPMPNIVYNNSNAANKNEMRPEYKELFNKFVEYFTKESDKLGDSTLLHELENANKIMTIGTSNVTL